MIFKHFDYMDSVKSDRYKIIYNNGKVIYLEALEEKSSVATIKEDPFLNYITKLKQPVEYNPALGKLVDTSPKDGISSVNFAKDSDDYLFASSFDRRLYIYCPYNKILIHKFTTPTPLLDVCGYDMEAFTAGADRKIRVHIIDYGTTNCYGQHKDRITAIDLTFNNKLLVSSGLDGQIKLWDSKYTNKLVRSTDTEKGIFCMDVKDNYIAVGCRQRVIKVYDIRRMDNYVFSFESLARGQIKSLKLTEKNDGVIVGTMDGVMYTKLFNSPKNVRDSCLIDAHSFYKENGGSLGFAINSIVAYNGGSKYFTGGSDGVINCWAKGRKIQMDNFPSYPTSISSLAINNSNNTLAVASSYKWEQLDIKHPVDQIYFKDIRDNPYLS